MRTRYHPNANQPAIGVMLAETKPQSVGRYIDTRDGRTQSKQKVKQNTYGNDKSGVPTENTSISFWTCGYTVYALNELLTYVILYRHVASTALLKKVVLNFFSATEMALAKPTLLSNVSCLAETLIANGGRGSSSRPQHEAEFEDLCGALNYLDNLDALYEICFVTVDLDRIQKYSPEELRVSAVVDRQNSLEDSIACLLDINAKKLTSLNTVLRPIK
jgi:hypothetical protein